MISLPVSSNSASSSSSNTSTNSSKFSYIKSAHNKFNKLTSGGANANRSHSKKEPKINSSTTHATNNPPVFNSTGTMMPSVASRLKKNFSRTKEKILQGIGKTDRTSDNNFDLYVNNFETQNKQECKLEKKLNKYLN